MDILYPPTKGDGRINQLAKRAIRAVGVREKPTVLDAAAWPTRRLARDEYRPLAWCTSMVEQLAGELPRGDVGFLSVAYNISSEPEVLPSVSARVAAALELELDLPPDERPFLGCAGGLFSLDAALRYCRAATKAAAVCTFDQCSWIVNPIVDAADDMTRAELRDHLRASMLFADGGVGLLLVPAGRRPAFRRPLLRVIDSQCDFVAGRAVRLREGSLRFDQGLEHEVPALVARRVVRPMLERNGLDVAEVDEWALHQGGRPLLERFGDPAVLGLSEAQRRRSLELFSRYGNLSAASCLFVLDSFLRDAAITAPKPGRKGMIVGFGAGYYLGALLYEWEAP